MRATSAPPLPAQVLALLLVLPPAGAADMAALCAPLEAQAEVPYLVRQVDGNWQLLARRPAAEPARAAVAGAKGSLAAHLAGGKEQRVTWSGASWQGPARCKGFSAVLLTVPAASVGLPPAPVAPLELGEAEATLLNERRMLGLASAAELLRLAAYYQLAGDSEQAASLAAQAARLK